MSTIYYLIAIKMLLSRINPATDRRQVGYVICSIRDNNT